MYLVTSMLRISRKTLPNLILKNLGVEVKADKKPKSLWKSQRTGQVTFAITTIGDHVMAGVTDLTYVRNAGQITEILIAKLR